MHRLRSTTTTSSLITRHYYAVIRHHMSHGSEQQQQLLATAPIPTGPRDALQLGFDSARASQNVLRLLESSHGSSGGGGGAIAFGETLSTAWHSTGLRWSYGGSGDDDDGWTCSSITDIDDRQSSSLSAVVSRARAPRLEWLNFSDDRTALAKIRGIDGLRRYVSLIRLDPDENKTRHGTTRANDGWSLVREVQCASRGSSSSRSSHRDSSSSSSSSMIKSVADTLETYLSIEHGGGTEDKAKARQLFAPDASLVTVGTASLDDERTAWSAPSGSFLEIPLETYLRGVERQSPHSEESKVHDNIVQIDVMPSGGSAAAAAATVHVGNGARTTIFVDYLLLGYHDDRWQILSKIFSPRAWPESI